MPRSSRFAWRRYLCFYVGVSLYLLQLLLALMPCHAHAHMLMHMLLLTFTPLASVHVHVSQMMSVGCSVLSERAYHRDEAEYEGIVHFADNVSSAFLQLADRYTARTEAAAAAASRFRERFAPGQVFRRAGLYSRFGLVPSDSGWSGVTAKGRKNQIESG